MDHDDEDFPRRRPDLAYEIGKSMLQTQLDAVDALDSKVGVTFGFASAVLAIPLALLALDPEVKHWLVIALLSGGGVAYLACSFVSLTSLWVQDWSAGPDLKELWENSKKADDTGWLRYSDESLRWWAADVYMTSFEDNVRPLRNKSLAALGAMALLAIETTLMAGALIAALEVT